MQLIQNPSNHNAIAALKYYSHDSYPSIPSVLDIKNSCMTASGGHVIALAREHIGVKPDDAVLIPAYRCKAMVVPVKWMGIKPAEVS